VQLDGNLMHVGHSGGQAALLGKSQGLPPRGTATEAVPMAARARTERMLESCIFIVMLLV